MLPETWIEGLWAEGDHGRVGAPVRNQVGEPEAARILEGQLRAIGELELEVTMLADPERGLADEDPPGHAEMDEQGGAGLEIEEQVLAAPPWLSKTLTDEAATQGLGLERAAHLDIPSPDRFDAATWQVLC
jgi:hypothetical protein